MFPGVIKLWKIYSHPTIQHCSLCSSLTFNLITQFTTQFHFLLLLLLSLRYICSSFFIAHSYFTIIFYTVKVIWIILKELTYTTIKCHQVYTFHMNYWSVSVYTSPSMNISHKLVFIRYNYDIFEMIFRHFLIFFFFLVLGLNSTSWYFKW